MIILDEILPANPVAERIITGGSLLLVHRKSDATSEKDSGNRYLQSDFLMDQKKAPTLIYKTGAVDLSPSPKKSSENVPFEMHL